ncbi:MAG: hypothetical protein O3B74_10755, partial [Proteobacteria bacterium]|nr:hypothetical protein [Pseudomonadota bacterium]
MTNNIIKNTRTFRAPAAVVSLPDMKKKTDAPSEDQMALEFAAENRDDLRYVAMWSRWMRFTGGVWSKDSTLAVYDQVRTLCRRHGPA